MCFSEQNVFLQFISGKLWSMKNAFSLHLLEEQKIKKQTTKHERDRCIEKVFLNSSKVKMTAFWHFNSTLKIAKLLFLQIWFFKLIFLNNIFAFVNGCYNKLTWQIKSLHTKNNLHNCIFLQNKTNPKSFTVKATKTLSVI